MLIIFILYVLAALLNFYRLRLEDSLCYPHLQNVLLVVSIIFAILSLPVSVVCFCIGQLYMGRVINQHEHEMQKLRLQSSKTPITNLPANGEVVNSHQNERLYFVTTFDGLDMRIWESDLEKFESKQEELREEYFSKYGYIVTALQHLIDDCIFDYLNKYSEDRNSTSYLLFGTGLVHFSSILYSYYPIISALDSYLLSSASNMSADTVSNKNAEDLKSKQLKFIQEVNNEFPITNRYQRIPECMRFLFINSCPHSFFTGSAELALIKLNQSLDSEISKDLDSVPKSKY